MRALLSAPIFTMRSRFMLTKAQIVLAQAKNHQERNWESIQFAIFKSSKFAVELNRVLLEFLLLCHVHIQESSPEENAKFNFLRIIWESKGPEGSFFSVSKKLSSKNPNPIYWLHYKPPEQLGGWNTWNIVCSNIREIEENKRKPLECCRAE